MSLGWWLGLFWFLFLVMVLATGLDAAQRLEQKKKCELPLRHLIGVPTVAGSLDFLVYRKGTKAGRNCSGATIVVGLDVVQWHPPCAVDFGYPAFEGR